ncbi:MAG TPA: TonB-dependent receptor [Gemmatimonadales bacterium]
MHPSSANAACAGVLTLAFIAHTAGAQTDSAGRRDSARITRLETISVTAERPRAVAPPVTTIDVPAAELRRTFANDAYDLLRRTTGIEVHEQGQGPGFASDAVIRGFSSDHSSDVLLMLDGVPINLPVHGHVEGYSDWSLLSPAAVSALRVITGPASPLYGDFSLAGVVEVFSAADAEGTSGSVGGSSHGDAAGWIRSGQRSGQGGFLAALDGRRQQGWRDNSEYWLGNGTLRGWRRAGHGRIEGGLSLYGSDWNSPGFVSITDYNAERLDGAMDPTDGGSAYRAIANGRLSTLLGETGLEATAWLQRVHSDVFLTIPEDNTLNQSDELDRRWALGGRMQLSRPVGGGDVSVGLDGRYDLATYDLYRTQAREVLLQTKGYDARYLGGGAFARWRSLVGSRVALDLGLRADLLRYRTLDRLAGGDWRSATDAIVSPKLGARYLAGGGWSLLASLSQGFRGTPGIIADPTLDPIRGWSKELGVRYDGPTVRAQLAAFRLDVSHERIQDPVTREVLATGRSKRQGLNAEAEVRLNRVLTLSADGTINDAVVKGGGDRAEAAAFRPSLLSLGAGGPALLRALHIEPPEPGDWVPNVARWLGRVRLQAAFSSRIAGWTTLRFSGPYTPIGEPDAETQSYAVADLGFSLALGAVGPVLDLELQNVLDAKYPEIRASGFLNPGAPRTLRAALRFAERP